MIPSTPEAVIAAALEGRVRTFTCCDCGEDHVTLRLTGRLPERCMACAPYAPASVRERADRAQRAAIVGLHTRVTELQGLVEQAGRGDEYTRGRKYGPPGRVALGRAVKRVALSVGAHGTGEALLDLAAAARAWAYLLGATETTS